MVGLCVAARLPLFGERVDGDGEYGNGVLDKDLVLVAVTVVLFHAFAERSPCPIEFFSREHFVATVSLVYEPEGKK